MKAKSRNVIRNTTLLAVAFSFMIVILVPLGYFILSYRYQSAVIITEAELMAEYLSQIISRNPEMWRFEQYRLDEILSDRIINKENFESRRILDLNNSVVAQNRDVIESPVLTRRADLYDSGTVVGRIEISRSLRTHLLHTFFATIIGMFVSGALYITLKRFPLRALAETLQSLQESEEKFRTMAATAADAMVLIDDKGSVTFWNSTAEKMFGYSVDEALGKELHILITPKEYYEKYRHGLEFFSQSGKGPAVAETIEFTALRKNGAMFPVEVSISAIRMQERWHAVGIIRDISYRKKMEEELLKIEKLESLGILAGGIAHDFNNILTGILGNIALAKMRTEPGDKAYERLENAEKAVIRAEGLTQQLLTFAKGGEPVKKTVNIRQLVKDACEFSLSGSSVKGLFSLPEDLWTVEADEGQISQVLNSITINAVHAMPDGGEIEVSAENLARSVADHLPILSERYVRITITDHGIGMPKEYLSKIFDPYFTTKSKGHGLGLASAYSIVKKHQGHIQVKSNTGEGTTIHVYLPASDKQVLMPLVEDDKVVGGKGRVLIMDDEEIVRSVAGEILHDSGYEVAFAADGAEAVFLYDEAFKSGNFFDAVIMDLTIPGGMGGKEAAQKILETYPQAKILVSSGYSSDPVMADFRKYGFVEVVPKPYKIEELTSKLHSVIAGGMK